jgi:hypothetical protein
MCVIKVMDNKQELEKNKYIRRTLVYLLRKYSGICFLTLFITPIGVTIFAYDQLIYPGYTPHKQPEETSFIPTQSSISTFSDPTSNIPPWLIIAVISCCAMGSFVIFYLLQNARENTKATTARQKSKVKSQKSKVI